MQNFEHSIPRSLLTGPVTLHWTSVRPESERTTAWYLLARPAGQTDGGVLIPTMLQTLPGQAPSRLCQDAAAYAVGMTLAYLGGTVTLPDGSCLAPERASREVLRHPVPEGDPRSN